MSRPAYLKPRIPPLVMKRRTFLALLPGSLLAAPLAAEAQQAGKIPRIGFLATPSAEVIRGRVTAF